MKSISPHTARRKLSCALAVVLLLGSCQFLSQPAPAQPDTQSPGDAPGDFVVVDDPAAEEAVHRSEGDEDLEIDLSIPADFRITRPESGVLTTSYDYYFITGTSDPGQPVYFTGNEDPIEEDVEDVEDEIALDGGDDEAPEAEEGYGEEDEDEGEFVEREIERQGASGVFGVRAKLEPGENLFLFRQGDDVVEVAITRLEDDGAEITLITDITESSMFPPVRAGVKVGQTVPVSCIAPAGGTVVASFGGDELELEQVVPTASEGVPAVFRGYLPIAGDYDEDVTVNGGPISYQLTYKGETTSHSSSGDLYVAGANSAVALRVNNYIGFLYPDTSDLSVFQEKPKLGAVDYLLNQNSRYFELASGGFIPVEMADIIEGEVSLEHTLSDVDLEVWDDEERFSFRDAGTPMYRTKLDQAEGVFTLTLYNTRGAPLAGVSSSKLFEKVQGAEGDNSVTYELTLKEGAQIWGYNLRYEDGDLLLQFFYRPELTGSDEEPLQGIRILLDPGHGGSDDGANGLPGRFGPQENLINLAHAYATRDRLRELGAEVFLTRSGDDYYSLDDRLQDIEDLNADFFLSIHHNSVPERSDANEIHGMEVYYHDSLSAGLGQTMMTALEQGLGRKGRFVSQSYYRVTLTPYAPAILMELGYLSNPLEYEKLTNPGEIEKVADAVAQGVLQALR